MQGRHRLHQGKPQPRTRQGARRVGPKKPLSCAGPILRRQAWAFITHADLTPVACGGAGVQADRAALGREFHRIVQKIGDGLQHHVTVAHHLKLVGPGCLQMLAAFFGQSAINLCRIRQHLGQIKGCEGRAACPGLSLRNAEQSLEDAADTIQVSNGGFHRRAQAFLIRGAH